MAGMRHRMWGCLHRRQTLGVAIVPRPAWGTVSLRHAMSRAVVGAAGAGGCRRFRVLDAAAFLVASVAVGADAAAADVVVAVLREPP